MRSSVCALGVTWLSSAAIGGVGWGTQTSGSIADIRPSGGQSNATVDFYGDAGVPLSAVDIDDAVLPDFFGDGPWNRGRSRASATLNVVPNTPPQLRAESRLTGNISSQFQFGSFPNGATSFAQAFASDIFQYVGSAPTTLGLTYTLDVNLSNDPPDASFQTYAFAQLAVFDIVNYAFFPSLSTLIHEFGAVLLQSGGVDAQDELYSTTDTGGTAASYTLTVNFDVVPGQAFYVFAKMGTGAARGARFADAYHTFSGEFSSPGDVISLSVPSPGAAAVAIAAWAAGVRRRRRAG